MLHRVASKGGIQLMNMFARPVCFLLVSLAIAVLSGPSLAVGQEPRQWRAEDVSAVGAAALSALRASSTQTANDPSAWLETSKALLNFRDVSDGGVAARQASQLLAQNADWLTREDIVGALAASGDAKEARALIPGDEPRDRHIRDLAMLGVGSAMAGQFDEAVKDEAQGYAMMTAEEQTAPSSPTSPLHFLTQIGVALALYGSRADAMRIAATLPDLSQVQISTAIAEAMCGAPKLTIAEEQDKAEALARIRKIVEAAPHQAQDKTDLTSIAIDASEALATCGTAEDLNSFLVGLRSDYDVPKVLEVLRLFVGLAPRVVARRIVTTLVQPDIAAIELPPPGQTRPSRTDFLRADAIAETQVGLFDLAMGAIPGLDTETRIGLYHDLLQAELSVRDHDAMAKTAAAALAIANGAPVYILFDDAHSLVLGGLQQQAQSFVAVWKAAVAANTQYVPPSQNPAADQAILAAVALGPKVALTQAEAAGPLTVPLSGTSRLLLAIMASDSAKNQSEAMRDAQKALARMPADTSGPGAVALDQIIKDYAASGDIPDALQLASKLAGDSGLAEDFKEDLQAIAAAQLKAGDLQEALHTVSMIRSPDARWPAILNLLPVPIRAPPCVSCSLEPPNQGMPIAAPSP